MRKMISILLMVVFFVGLGKAHVEDMYYCPMHTNYQSDKPGKCPICHMNLVKKQDTGLSPKSGHGRHAIILSEAQMKLLGIVTVEAKRQPLKKIVRTGGYVSTMNDIYEAQDAYIKAHIEYVEVFRDQKRFAHKRRNWESHRDVQLRLHHAEDALLRFGFNHHEIKKLQEYSWATPWEQAGLSFFNQNQHFWVVAQFYEQDLGYIEVGQDVKVEIPAYHETVPGKIKTVGQILDPMTRTVNALIEIPIYRGELIGNMFVNVTVDVELNEYLMVPQEAVMDTGARKIVFVETSPGVFVQRDVMVVALGDNGWAIRKGISLKENVVVQGNFLLDSESKLQSNLAGGHDD